MPRVCPVRVPHACSLSWWVHMHPSCFLVSLLFSIPSGSYSLRAFSSTGFPDRWGEGIEGNNPLDDGRSKVSHSGFCPAVGLSVFVPIYCGQELLSWRLSKTIVYMICNCSRMLLGIISLLGPFSRTVVFVFPLVPRLYSLRFLMALAMLGWGPSQGVGLKSHQIVVGYSHKIFFGHVFIYSL